MHNERIKRASEKEKDELIASAGGVIIGANSEMCSSRHLNFVLTVLRKRMERERGGGAEREILGGYASLCNIPLSLVV